MTHPKVSAGLVFATSRRTWKLATTSTAKARITYDEACAELGFHDAPMNVDTPDESARAFTPLIWQLFVGHTYPKVVRGAQNHPDHPRAARKAASRLAGTTATRSRNPTFRLPSSVDQPAMTGFRTGLTMLSSRSGFNNTLASSS